MADNQVVIDVVTNFNVDSLEKMNKYVSGARQEIVAMKQELSGAMDGLDGPARLLSEQLDKCVAAADNVSKKTKEANANLETGNMTDADRASPSRFCEQSCSPSGSLRRAPVLRLFAFPVYEDPGVQLLR